MNEFWAVYDEASGEFVYAGSGPPGTAAIQDLPEGRALTRVPASSLLPANQIDLGAVRAQLEMEVDAQADQLAQRFITPGIRKALTYPRKEAAARAWLADNTASTMFLEREATARGITIAALATEVVALADAWAEVGDLIEAATQGAKTAIRAATTLGHVVAAGRVDWEAVVAPAA